MTFPALFTLIVTLVAAVLLISEKLRPDLAALLVLAALGISGVVTPAETFAGFGGSAVMTIVAISIISEGLRQTGVTRSLGRLMYRLAGASESRQILVAILTSAALSLVMNNIAAVGVLLPAVMTLARRGKIAPSRLMMPLAYGTVLGGMATLLTTANLIVSGALRDAGHKPFGLLDFLPIGGPIVLVGTLYMLTLGRKLMPQRSEDGDSAPQQLHQALSRLYGLEQNLHEIEVLQTSPLAGRSIAAGRWTQSAHLHIVSITRGERVILAPNAEETVLAGDRLLAQGRPDPLLLEKLGLHQRLGTRESLEVTDAGITLAELVITPHGALAGRSLQQVDFRENYNLNVLGIWREGHPIQENLAELKLRVGDALLVQGEAARLQMLQHHPDLVLLEEDPDAARRPRKFNIALIITLATLVLAAVDIFPIAVVTFAGAGMLLLTGCMDMNDAYRTIEWKAVFLIAGMWPLSTAIRTTGLADQAIQGLLGVLGDTIPLVVALALILVALLITQIMSSQVAALVLAPLALVAAQQVGADPRALGMAVALGCSLCFPTPFGHPVNIMVMTPGGYAFRDYMRVGLPLTVIAIGVILLGLKVFWGM